MKYRKTELTPKKFVNQSKMVNETQSFSQYKDKAHSVATDSIQRVIGTETYQPKLVQNWVDSIGQDIVNKLRVRFKKFVRSPCFVGSIL